MERDDFNQFLKHFAASFPDAGQWLTALPNRKETLSQWLAILTAKRVTLELARQALDAIAAGDAQCPKGFERDQWPAFIVRAIRELKLRSDPSFRAESDLTRNREKYTRPPAAVSVWEMVELARRMRKAGASQLEIERAIDEADRIAFPS